MGAGVESCRYGRERERGEMSFVTTLARGGGDSESALFMQKAWKLQRVFPCDDAALEGVKGAREMGN